MAAHRVDEAHDTVRSPAGWSTLEAVHAVPVEVQILPLASAAAQKLVDGQETAVSKVPAPISEGSDHD
ncbi:hypothetical protein GCM10027053_47860 [Intrasporangium mesophilum]